MDPLSITAGVATLLKTTYTIGAELKSFHDGVKTIDTRLEGLLNDVDGLKLVLESMRATCAAVSIDNGTGHVGSHWRNISRSLEDGQGVLIILQGKLQSVNKTGKHLDAIRKQLRLNFATDEIAHYQQQIQSYRDALQLSVQAVILWNQVSYQKSVDAVVPKLSDLQSDIRRIAQQMNSRIDSMQSSVPPRRESHGLSNLRECVRSAASVISSASSVMSSQGGRGKPLSDFGDCFPAEQSVALQRWMDSRSVHEYDRQSLYQPPQSVADVSTIDGSHDDSDSDSDLETEMTHALLISGKQKLAHGYEQEGERLLRFCLAKLTTIRSSEARPSTPSQATQSVEAADKLLEIYYARSDWTNAQSVLEQRLAIRARLAGRQDTGYLDDLLRLASLLQRKNDNTAAQVQARKALKGYKKLRSSHPGIVKSLTLLLELSQALGQEDDAEAFTIMLTEANIAKTDGHFVEHLDEVQHSVPTRSPPPPPEPEAEIFQIRSSEDSFNGSTAGSITSSDISKTATDSNVQSSLSASTSLSINTSDTPITSTTSISQPDTGTFMIRPLNVKHRPVQQTSDVPMHVELVNIEADMDTNDTDMRDQEPSVDAETLVLNSVDDGLDGEQYDNPGDDEQRVEGRDLEKHDSMIEKRDLDTLRKAQDDDSNISCDIEVPNTEAHSVQTHDELAEFTDFMHGPAGPIAFLGPFAAETNSSHQDLDDSILRAVLQAAHSFEDIRVQNQCSSSTRDESLGHRGHEVSTDVTLSNENVHGTDASDEESVSPFEDSLEVQEMPIVLPSPTSQQAETTLPSSNSDEILVSMDPVTLEEAQAVDHEHSSRQESFANGEQMVLERVEDTSDCPSPTEKPQNPFDDPDGTSPECMMDAEQERLAFTAKSPRRSASPDFVADARTSEETIREQPPQQTRAGETALKSLTAAEGEGSRDFSRPTPAHITSVKRKPVLSLRTRSSQETVRRPYVLGSSDIFQELGPNPARSILNAESLAKLSQETGTNPGSRKSHEVSSIISVAGSVRGPHPSLRGRFKTRNIAVVGETYVGKSALIGRFQSGTMPTQLSITMIPDPTQVKHKEQNLHMDFRDTCGLMEFERLRLPAYNDAHVVLLCFALDEPDSLANIEYGWAEEVAKACPNRPVILVGTKQDVAESERTKERLSRDQQHSVTQEEAMAMCKRIGALKYLQCSAATGDGITEVFEAAVTTVLRQPTTKRSRVWNLKRFSRNEIVVE